MSEEFDLEKLPGNPRLMETFREFCLRQRKFVKTTRWPPGTTFECRRCGDCCTWNFWHFTSDPKLVEELHRLGGAEPHGAWVLLKDRVSLSMPFWIDEALKKFVFIGKLPPDHLEFHRITGRTHGYWVLNAKGRVIIYSPTTCIHLAEDGLCNIYEDRPRVCRKYICGRYPIIP